MCKFKLSRNFSSFAIIFVASTWRLKHLIGLMLLHIESSEIAKLALKMYVQLSLLYIAVSMDATLKPCTYSNISEMINSFYNSISDLNCCHYYIRWHGSHQSTFSIIIQKSQNILVYQCLNNTIIIYLFYEGLKWQQN